MNQHKSRSENNKTVRQANVRAILDLFLDDSQATVEGAMARTGLSYPTVLSIFKELQRAGVIDRFGYADSTGGRQASLYSFNPNCGYALGIHLSGGGFSMAITNLRGGIIYEHREEIEFELRYLGTAACGLIDTALDHTGIRREELLAAGLCLSAGMRAPWPRPGWICAVSSRRPGSPPSRRSPSRPSSPTWIRRPFRSSACTPSCT